MQSNLKKQGFILADGLNGDKEVQSTMEGMVWQVCGGWQGSMHDSSVEYKRDGKEWQVCAGQNRWWIFHIMTTSQKAESAGTDPG